MKHSSKHREDGWWLLIKEEMACHLPYAVFSVIIGMITVGAFMHLLHPQAMYETAHQLFHGFHFLHLLFAGTSVVLTFRKYSQSIISCLFVGLVVPTLFCTMSDAFLPYFGGVNLGLPVHFHWCFRDHLFVVLPFLIVGIINGLAISSWADGKRVFLSAGSHISHILISSIASIFYLVSFGLENLWSHAGLLFFFLVVAVLIPCTLSDIIVPVSFAVIKRKPQKESQCGCAGRDHA